MMIKNSSALAKYVKGFFEFENYINSINTHIGTKFEKLSGYLINVNDIERIKETINYEKIKDKYIHFQFDEVDQIKYYTLDEIAFRDSNYLLNMIFNENKYIFINVKLWKLLCKENKENATPITYEINYSEIKFKLNDEKELIFTKYHNNGNYIMKDYFYYSNNPSYNFYLSNFNNIVENIYKKIIGYYNYHEKFISELKYLNKMNMNSGYFVDLDWFKKWEEYYNYINIKTNYLDKKKSEQETLNYILYLKQINKINSNFPYKPKIYKFTTEEEFFSALQYNKLIIINTSLITSKVDLYDNVIYYYLYKGRIELNFEYKSLILKINDNNIQFQNDGNDKKKITNTNLDQLVRIFYFRKYIREEMKKRNSTSKENKQIFLIKKSIISKYLNICKYQNLNIFLNGKYNQFNYKNLENNLSSIIEIIKKELPTFYEENNRIQNLSSIINCLGFDYNLIPKKCTSQGKILTYISDFEILDGDIYSFFEKNKIISEKQVIKGEYISDGGKIFLCYNFNNLNYYEIGKFDESNENFIVEYIIEDNFSNKNLIFQYFLALGIETMIGKMMGNKLQNEANLNLNCHRFQDNINGGNFKSVNPQENQINIIDIISALMSLRIYEKEIMKKSNDSMGKSNDSVYNIYSKPFSNEFCKLVNGEYILKLKNIFNYAKIRKFMHDKQINNYEDIKKEIIEKIFIEDQSYKNFILSKKTDFLKLKENAFEFCKINKQLYEKQNNFKFFYPIKFYILNQDLFNEFSRFLDIKEKNTDDILLTFSNGNIAFKGISESFCGNYMFLLYIYSCKFVSELGNINYNPEAILSFKTKDDLNNQFLKITKENIIDSIMHSQNNLTSKYGCEICLTFTPNNQIVNTNDETQLNDSILYNNDSNKYFNQLLHFSFYFWLKYKNYYESIKTSQTKIEAKIYLINKKYIDELKSILCFDEIGKVLKEHNEIKEYFIKGDINFFSILKQFLDKKILKKFFTYKKIEILQKLNDPTLFDKSSKLLFNDQYNNLFYYENFTIFDKEFFDTLNKLDTKINEKCFEANAVLSDGKIILFLSDIGKYVINVGKLNSIDEFDLEFLIQSLDNSSIRFDLKKIFGEFGKIGYNNFKKKHIKNEMIQTIIEQMPINAKIYRISSVENEINIDTQKNYDLSEKLKAILLVSISQTINLEKFHEYSQKKIEKVYLMDYNYLMKYRFEEIFSLINQNVEIQKLIEEINDPQIPYDPNTLDNIISKLDRNKLNEIDKVLQTIDISRLDWEAKPDKLTLRYNTVINAYKNFILVKGKIFKEISKKLSLYLSQKDIEYFYTDGDLLIINEYSQPVIFYGYMNRESHLFSLTYIIHIRYHPDMSKELKFIQEQGIKKYINEKTVFSGENSKDLISPIYDGNNEIGTFYKYNPGTNYNDIKADDYSLYMDNENLNKVLKLYNYYNEFKEKMNDKYERENKYYLVSKFIMDDIKKEYNYDIIVETLNKAQINTKEKNQKKEKLYILKNLPEDIYEDFIKNKKRIEKREKNFIAPDKISVSIPDSPNDSVQIYNNFEIIDIYTSSDFIKDISFSDYKYSSYGVYGNYGSYGSLDPTNKDENKVECTLTNGKIIVYYPKGTLNQNKYVYIIGTLDNKNTFIGEYLIYYTKEHSDFRKNKANYLKSMDQLLIYGPSPIMSNDTYEEIGKIISLKGINSSYIQKIDINKNITPGTMDIEEEIDSDKKKPKDGENTNKNKTTITKSSKINIKEYNLDALVQFNSINNNFKWPPLIGLDNIGATCYMNATLQCLCNILKFINYFKYNKHLIETVRGDLMYTENSTLTSSFKLLMEKLWPDRLYYYNASNSGYNLLGNIGTNNTYSNKNNESYAPKEFKAKISKMNDLFKGVAANDAKDLVQFLIMTLHKELNLAQNQNLNNNAINQDQRNKQLMFKIFTQDFVNTNKSIISDLFYGVNYNTIQCQGCFTKSYNFQTYFFFVFPLEEVRIFKNQNNMNNFNNNMNNFNNNMNNFNNNMNNFNNNMNNFNNNMNNFNNNMINVNNNMINVNNNMNNFNNNMNNNEINIYDCFYYDQRINYMSGQNAMYCNYCKNTCISAMCTNLAFGPEVIIIILNRGQGIQYKVKINFFEDLNLYNFIEYKETGVNYKLIGVVTHLGENDSSGHFIAYCKNPINLKWYQFNDSVVNEVINFKAEVIDYAMPYLLFYQKITSQ